VYLLKLVITLILVVLSTHALAYGNSSSSKKACNKPTLTQIQPPPFSVMASQATFSFQTSNATDPDSIKVVANKFSINVDIKKLNSGYFISAALPASIQKKYVRVDVNASTTSRCSGVNGWLFKMEDS